MAATRAGTAQGRWPRRSSRKVTSRIGYYRNSRSAGELSCWVSPPPNSGSHWVGTSRRLRWGRRPNPTASPLCAGVLTRCDTPGCYAWRERRTPCTTKTRGTQGSTDAESRAVFEPRSSLWNVTGSKRAGDAFWTDFGSSGGSEQILPDHRTAWDLIFCGLLSFPVESSLVGYGTARTAVLAEAQASSLTHISDSTAGPAHEEQMLSTSRLFARDYTTAADIIRDHRVRVAIEAAAVREQRRVEQAKQYASSAAPETRIRAWERVHGLRLPLNPAHPIVAVIAIKTHLTVAEVQHEQRARSAAERPRSKPR